MLSRVFEKRSRNGIQLLGFVEDGDLRVGATGDPLQSWNGFGNLQSDMTFDNLDHITVLLHPRPKLIFELVYVVLANVMLLEDHNIFVLMHHYFSKKGDFRCGWTTQPYMYQYNPIWFKSQAFLEKMA